MENDGDLQPTARSMNLTLWVMSENLFVGLLPMELLKCLWNENFENNLMFSMKEE